MNWNSNDFFMIEGKCTRFASLSFLKKYDIHVPYYLSNLFLFVPLTSQYMPINIVRETKCWTKLTWLEHWGSLLLIFSYFTLSYRNRTTVCKTGTYICYSQMFFQLNYPIFLSFFFSFFDLSFDFQLPILEYSFSGCYFMHWTMECISVEMKYFIEYFIYLAFFLFNS